MRWGILLLLAGCAQQDYARDDSIVQAGSVKTYDVPGAWIREFRLDDGTKCVYVYNAGITCDWKEPK